MNRTPEPREALPVAAMLPQLEECFNTGTPVVIQAAPGAGKTMLVPPALSRCAGDGMVILIEPRRIAAKAAAAGIAWFNGFELGRECGFAVRGESCRSGECRILAVTPGVYLNMLNRDPELAGVAGVIFDEFHERSVECDLALALTLELRTVLRPELKLVVMSATLDAGKVAELLGAVTVNVPGREFPVETIYRSGGGELFKVPGAAAAEVMRALPEYEGNILVFLPGKGEISRCMELLQNSGVGSGGKVKLYELHGSLPLAQQSAVLRPEAPGWRKVILATNVAESSLTIDDVRVVIDSGWERRMRFSPGAGLSFLEPCRITLASAAQRAGRAGRSAPGVALRLWDKLDERNFSAHTVPEILECDLSAVALAVAAWGSRAAALPWLTPPPEGAYSQAEKSLQKLGLLDGKCRLTPAGKRAAALPVHPRLGAMLLAAEGSGKTALAAEIAALLSENDFRSGGSGCDLRLYLSALQEKPGRFKMVKQSSQHLREIFHCSGEKLCASDIAGCGMVLAAAFPEWVGRRREGKAEIYQFSGGGAGVLADGDTLQGEEFIAVAKLDGISGRNSRISLAAPVSAAEIEKLFSSRIRETISTTFDPASGRAGAVAERRLGEVVFSAHPVAVDGETAAAAVLDEALRRKIVLFEADSSAGRLLARIGFAARSGEEGFAGFAGEDMEAMLREAAMPFIGRVRDFAALLKAPWYDIVSSLLSYELRHKLDTLFPDSYRAPSGAEFKIDYSGEQPTLSLKIQHLYGEKRHPAVGSRKIPLRLEMLSPAMRPVQISCDLPGFWQGSWQLVRREMRGRYPKHEWPEDPANAEPMRNSVRKKAL